MRITRTSPLTGKTNTLEIDITPKDYKRWENGEAIQDVVPHLSPEIREFILTGLMPGEFLIYLGPTPEELEELEELDEQD
jgi:hypothetical protein